MDEHKKFKRGDKREDGKLFWQYRNRNGRISPVFISEECYKKCIQKGLEASARWKKENADRVRHLDNLNHKKRRKENPEKEKQNRERFYKKNRERLLAKKREDYKNNREKILQKALDWQARNLDKARVRNSKRRSKKRNATHLDHDPKIELTLIRQCQSLQKRLGIKFEVDHIVPISKGGFHHHLNLHVIPAYWNRVKHTKDIDSIPQCWNPVFRKN